MVRPNKKNKGRIDKFDLQVELLKVFKGEVQYDASSKQSSSTNSSKLNCVPTIARFHYYGKKGSKNKQHNLS